MHKLRQLKLLIAFLLSKRSHDPLRPVVCRFLITPFDVDVTRAVSHTYLAFSALGRWCYTFHNVDWNKLFSERLAPLTHSELVHYHRAARLFTTVTIITTIIWWDEKMAYFEHRILQGESVAAIVYSRGTFFAGKKRLPPSHCTIGLPPAPEVEMPEIVEFWSTADRYFKMAEASP